MNRTTMTRSFLASAVTVAMFGAGQALAADPSGTYEFDREGQHQFIQFRISHLGFSTLYGRFNDFDGSFEYDADNPEDSSVQVTVDTSSVDSNHSERDKHLREEDFLYVSEYPEATFESTSVEMEGEDTATVTGDLTLRGVTREIDLEMELINHGEDPWGNYRMGLEGTTTLTLENYGIDYDLGPQAEEVTLMLSVEGIRQ
ncbi:YceI family protein [Vreelandella utahensis]|uniref:YceI family protein n=1 Tax=Vreelandella halophila TaxID=86177 RepID=UPI001C4DFE16|nr:YceI family protein [Halomonas utahensis]